MRSLTVMIPQPCQERWDDMQPADRGRFCAGCQKTVVDYTHYTDRELVKLLSQSSETTCGRFRNEQLNRPLVQSNRGTSVWRSWVSLLTMSLFGWQTAKSQSVQAEKPAQQASIRPVFSVSAIPIQKSIDYDAKLTIHGRVMLMDSNHHLSPVSGGTVKVSQPGEEWQTQTDSSGLFSLSVPVKAQGDPIQTVSNQFTINVSVPDHSRGSAIINVKSSTMSVTIGDLILYKLMPRKDITGGGICVIQTPSRWQQLKRKLVR